MSRTPWTHFFVARDGRITGFNVDKCEQCGERVQAANSITLKETPARLRSLGLKELKTLPPEEWYVEELEGCACEDCITKMEAEANPKTEEV